MAIPLERVLTTVFDASGTAIIRAVPDRARERWEVTRYQVTTNSPVQTECNVYRGSTGSANIDYTRTGNADTSEQVHPLTVDHGNNALVFVWTRGTPGSTASVTIIGQIEKW